MLVAVALSLWMANARIAALQTELAAIDPAPLQIESDAGDDTIIAAYLARIEQLRLANGSFARETAPPAIFGHYGETQPLCLIIEGTNDYDCDHNGMVESFIDVKHGEGNRVKVASTLVFFNGHECNFGGDAEWADGALRVPQLEDTESKCVLLLHFDNGKVTAEDVSNVCRQYLCGMRGGFAHIELPKVKPKAKKPKKKR